MKPRNTNLRLRSVSDRAIAISALFLAVVAGTCEAGIMAPAGEVEAHLFLVEVNGEMRPIVDAQTHRVEVLRKDGSREWLAAEDYNILQRMVPSVGRVTLYETTGRTGQDVLGTMNSLSVSSQTKLSFKLVADREIADVYAAIFFATPGNEKSLRVGFGALGDLPAGERVTREARFGVQLSQQSAYWVEFYSKGLAIESLNLAEAALHPQSQGLLIPWADRMDVFRESMRKSEESLPAKPFLVDIASLDTQACKERGLEMLKLKLAVREDGTVELLESDAQLDSAESASLQKAAQAWRFFPAVEKGKPIAANVIIPLRF